MKIDSSTLTLAARHHRVDTTERHESLRAWTGDVRPDFESTGSAALITITARARLSLAIDFASIAPAEPAGKPPAVAESADAVESDPYISLIRSMIEMLTGESIRVFSAADLSAPSRPVPALTDPNAAGRRDNPPPRAGFGIEYDSRSTHTESEATDLAAEGVVRTADGQEIRFQLQLSMHREFHEETRTSVRLGDAVRRDPLVLNFAGTAAQLSDRRFAFDLNGDGNPEEIPLLAAGSGYLAFDRNGNGRIDSGRELFGPASDQGFAELATLDADGNGWIDENDAAFASLKIWQPGDTGADGGQRLDSLAAMGIGALALAHVATPFDLRGSGNADLGAVRSSGLWLGEDGRAGTLQEIDLTV